MRANLKPLTVIMGTKGEYVKMAPVLRELDRQAVPYRLLHTHQHVQTTATITRIFNLREPDMILDPRSEDVTTVKDAARWFLRGSWQATRQAKRYFPYGKGIVLLHGDTPSTLLGLIIARLGGQHVAHIEAGLRSYDLLNPFPEEGVRVITSKFADYLFAPADWEYSNLEQEGLKARKWNTRVNTVYEALLYALERYRQAHADGSRDITTPPDRPFVVAVIHRLETILNQARLKLDIDIVLRVAKEHHVVFIQYKPTMEKLKQYGMLDEVMNHPNIEHRPYQDYFSFMNLIANCTYVVCDGGGLQEETYYLDRPCLLLRNTTERIIGLDETALLSKFEPARINYFLANYRQYCRRDRLEDVRPARIIVDAVRGLMNE